MREQRSFLLFISLFFLSTGLSGIFINTFIYSVAGMKGEFVSGVRMVAYYNLCMYAAMALSSVVIGILGKGLKSRVLMCIGACLYAFLYVLLLLLRSEAVNVVWLLGILAGIGSSMVNLNYSVAISYATTTSGRDYYLMLQSILSGITAIISPLIAGTLLGIIKGINGYVVLFAIALIILAASILYASALSYNDDKKGVTHFGNVFVFSLKNRGMRACAVSEFIGGIRDGIVSFFIPVLLFSFDMSNFAVGVYASVFALVQMFAASHTDGRITANNRIISVFFAGAIYTLSGFVLLAELGMLPVYIYGATTSFAQSVFSVAIFSLYFGWAYKMPNAHKKSLEILSVREFYVNMGKVAGVFVLLVMPHDTKYFIYTIIGAGALQLVGWLMLAYGGSVQKKPGEKIVIKLG